MILVVSLKIKCNGEGREKIQRKEWSRSKRNTTQDEIQRSEYMQIKQAILVLLFLLPTNILGTATRSSVQKF